MTNELRSRAGRLIEHYHRYGMFTTETSQPELLAKAGREVVWALDYLNLAGDLDHCLEYCESHGEAAICSEKDGLREDRNGIESILVKEIPAEELLKILAELVGSLCNDCASLVDMDLFYYELACGSRTQTEVCIELLRKGGKEGLMSVEIGKSIRNCDALMRASLAEIEEKYPTIARPFPSCPDYTPKSYWWILR